MWTTRRSAAWRRHIFWSAGFKNFGYFGSQWTGFSIDREQGFREALAAAGCQIFSCYADFLPRPPLASSWKQEDRQVRDWLTSLAKPAAVFASNDVPAPP